MTKPFIIAEIGINHTGAMDITKKLIDVAAEAGCDAVKFQKRTIDNVYTQDYLKESRDSPWGTTQREQKEGLEFGEDQYNEIDAYCKEKNIHWSASAWDVDSQNWLASKYNLMFNKVASAMITNTDFLNVVAAEGRNTYISTGMSTVEEIQTAVDIFREHNCPFTLLHCVSTYPCRDEDCNISGMLTLKNTFNCDVGYSGHERGHLPTIVAASLGATAIERHITLDRSMYGSDQSASLEPNELVQLTSAITSIDGILGTGEKVVSDAELSVAKKLRYWM